MLKKITCDGTLTEKFPKKILISMDVFECEIYFRVLW